MQWSTVPFLAAVVPGFLLVLARRLHRQGRLGVAEGRWIAALAGLLVGWGGLSGLLAGAGVYGRPTFRALMPEYWLPFVPVAMVVALVSLVRPLRKGLAMLAEETPAQWLTGIHQLRVLALGSILKAAQGTFPRGFAWYVGIPDLLFGISAILLTLAILRGWRPGRRWLACWHLTGAMVILVPATALMQVFRREPLFDALWAFPMVLAPTLVVPSLVMLNLLVVWRALAPGPPRPSRPDAPHQAD